MIKTIGEHWVCAALARCGWAPTEGTNRPLGTKAQFLAKSAYKWFVPVLLLEIPAIPRAFVVPRDHLSAAAWIVHQDWLTDPSVSPGTRNTGLDQARVSWSVWLGYEDKWGLLGIPTKEVPVLLPPKLRELALDERVGLPPDHPWRKDLPEW